MYVLRDDGSVDERATFKRAQYDNGIAAGAPPTFGPEPEAPRRESAPVATLLPRLGGGPVLTDIAPGITPGAPKGDETGPGVAAPFPSPSDGPLGPVLRDGGASPPRPGASAPGTARAVDWRLVGLGSLVLILLVFAVGRDE